MLEEELHSSTAGGGKGGGLAIFRPLSANMFHHTSPKAVFNATELFGLSASSSCHGDHQITNKKYMIGGMRRSSRRGWNGTDGLRTNLPGLRYVVIVILWGSNFFS